MRRICNAAAQWRSAGGTVGLGAGYLLERRAPLSSGEQDSVARHQCGHSFGVQLARGASSRRTDRGE